MSSCNENDIDTPGSNNDEGEKLELALQLAVPDHTLTSQLRSIGPNQESAIKEIDVLAFRVGNDGKDYFDYVAKSTKYDPDLQSDNPDSIRVIAWIKGYQQRFIVITNAHDKVQALIDSKKTANQSGEKGWYNTEKNAMLSLLEFSLGTDNMWKTLDASDYTAFPMWGESEPVTITSKIKQLPGKVHLLRMLAKIDVQLDETVTGLKSKFKLKSVRLYNTQIQGRIIPNSSAVQKTTNSIYVTAPSLPATPDKQLGPLVYTDFSSPGATDVAVRGAIYTFESQAPADNNPLDATCLVVGGLYGTDTQETYYRVDFLKDDVMTYDIIRRIYKSTINITNVMDRGHENPQEAFGAKAENMQTEVEVWAGNDLVVSFNGQYFLYVNKNRFDFSREVCTTAQNHNILVVNTNYETTAKKGWTISNITDENGNAPVNWLTVTAPNGTTNTGAYSESMKEDSLVLTYTQNTTGQPRYANIIFAAGRLRYTVQVVQNIREGVSITFYNGSGRIVGNELVPDGQVIDTLKFFYPSISSINQDALPFTITWTPKEAEVRVFETHKYVQPINGVIQYLNFNTNPMTLRVITSHNGIYVYHIGLRFEHTPGEREAMSNAQSAIGFYLSNGVEEIEKHIVFVCYPPQ
jgi:hypothetical protein